MTPRVKNYDGEHTRHKPTETKPNTSLFSNEVITITGPSKHKNKARTKTEQEKTSRSEQS